MEPRLTRFQQSSLRIEQAGLRIYIDPYHLPGQQPPADVLLISHDHRDHFSPDDIAKVRRPETTVFASRTAAEQLDPPVRTLLPGETASAGPLTIRTIPAYTITKLRSSGVPTHARQDDHLGLILELDGTRYYFAGDTDVTPEMASIGPVDYAFLPISGTYVMSVDEALEAVNVIKPRVAIPVHYGSSVGTEEDAERFVRKLPDGVEGRILPQTREA